MKHLITTIISIILGFACSSSFAEQNFADGVGSVRIGEAKLTTPIRVPCITWGGDIATFYANGGLRTKSGSIFARQGLNIELYVQDDPYQQAKDYMEGKTPFFRGTYRMCGVASEFLVSDPRTKPYMIVQLTWSAGDHCVARAEIRTIEDLKGKKIAIQKGGPHVGMLDDILVTANISWDDVTVLWADDLTGTPKSPAEMFRKDKSIAACFVISPDMIGLTGGLQNTGSGAEGTVKNARVLVSTAELSYSIADVYLVRKDFWEKHSDVVTKFVAGLLKAQEEVINLKKAYEASGSKKYMELLQLTQDIYGKDTIPTLEEDAHGLLSDCTFVGHPGNVAFFTKENNLHGFEVFLKKSLDLAVSRGYAKVRQGIFPSPVSWNSSAFIGYLTKTDIVRGERFRAEAVLEEIEALSAGGALDDRTILSFSINFQPNQITFSKEQYGVEYQRVISTLAKFGNAVIAIRGHSDPTKMLLETVRAGMKKGILRRSGTKGHYSYSLKGMPLNLSSTQQITSLVEDGEFDGVPEHNPREIMQAAMNLSRQRAEAVRDSIIDYAKKEHNQALDPTQIQPVGAGVRDPFIAKPRNMSEAQQNMRVEFRLIRVTAEAIQESDFDF